MKEGDFTFFLLAAAALAGFVFGLGAVVTGLDEDTWTKMTNREDCYFRETHVNNVWLTPGENSTTTAIYCKVED